MKITIFRYNGICISSVCVSILRCTLYLLASVMCTQNYSKMHTIQYYYEYNICNPNTTHIIYVLCRLGP